jgi:FAD synthetase
MVGGEVMNRKVKVLAGGVFNVVHPGHIFFLKKARSLGDELVVVVAHDETVRKSKRLIFPARERKAVLESLRMVDRVIMGDRNDFFLVIKKERPDVIVLGFDQKIDGKKLEKALEKGAIPRIVKLPRFREYGTKKLMEHLH